MKRRGLLLDRDGVVNEERGYVGSFEAFVFMPGLFAFLRTAQEKGYKIAIVTNQSGVGRGYYTRAAYEALTARMLDALAAEGILIDLVLASFEHPESVDPALARESFWRKPNPGMILEAAQRLRLDLSRSVMIGDRERDIQAARTAGVGRCVLLGGEKTSLPNVLLAQGFEALAGAI